MKNGFCRTFDSPLPGVRVSLQSFRGDRSFAIATLTRWEMGKVPLFEKNPTMLPGDGLGSRDLGVLWRLVGAKTLMPLK